LLSQKSISLSADLTTKAKYGSIGVDFQSQNYINSVGFWVGRHNSLNTTGIGLNYSIKTQKRNRNKRNLYLIGVIGYSFFRHEQPINKYNIHYLDFSIGYGMEYKISSNFYISNSISLGVNLEAINNTTSEINNYLIDASGLIRTGIVYKFKN